MRARAKNSPASRWPFWVLLAAWVCANSPQVAVCTALTWLAEARTFSHQRDLSQQVAQLLGGEAGRSRVGEALARMEAPERAEEGEGTRKAANAPTIVVLKKVDLAAEAVAIVVAPEARGFFGQRHEDAFAAVRRVAPPHGPPRGADV